MTRVFRLARDKYTKTADDLLSGGGAAAFGGRWNDKGTPMLYASSHLSLAVLEALVHSDRLPVDLMLVALDIPPRFAPGRWTEATLPKDWATYPIPNTTQEHGTAWALAARELAVWVPSAVVPLEDNCLLNPRHPAIAQVKARVLGPFRFDARLRP